MFRGFNLSFYDHQIDDYYKTGLQRYNEDRLAVKEGTERFLLPDGSLDGELMESEWFPNVEADVFISHSHADQKLAIAFSGWLYETFKLKCFIDSCIWGQSTKLLKNLDDKYCVSTRHDDGSVKTFSYDTRNRSTSLVYLMLSTALTKMIDRAECLMFLNTPESTTTKKVISDSTYSPWIYSEISISQMIRKLIPERYDRRSIKFFSKGGVAEPITESLKMKFVMSLGHLTDISSYDLIKWGEKYDELGSDKRYPLDLLYEKFPIDLSSYK
ncbi:hypothetical protein AY601_0944 [Pedobacter cryoconitis]|uniref:TIR domain-containing protein n=1 Tax=Pedobacter cryoconitis TaxID=188932 RepID=A0A127V971_9SPHI|nr:hypothetical protein [Pedobacter cryoconitis]AMP97883.1 hypothetical protein AY601_0944 [Pedobacter cryoconitis]